MATVLPGIWPLPRNPRGLDALIAETPRLLARFDDLSPGELRKLKGNLDRLADYAERVAAWTEEKGDPPQSTLP